MFAGIVLPNVSIVSHAKNLSSKPSCSIIRLGVVVINGCNMTAIWCKLSAKFRITVPNFGLSASSFANTHGCVSSIYLFVRETNVHKSANTTLNCIFSILSSYLIRTDSACSFNAASNSVD